MRKLGYLASFAGLAAALGIAGAFPALSARQEPAADDKLARILEKAQEYCRKLESAALDFTCLEKVEEKTFKLPSIKPDTAVNLSGGASGRMSYSYQSPDSGYSNQVIYDYQFVRKGGQETEKRTLIDDNGLKKHEENAQLTTLSVRAGNALFGPVGLLGAEQQAHYDYRIVDTERRKGKTYVVVEAVPKPSSSKDPADLARIWIREDDASIVKIAWNQPYAGVFAQVKALARELEAEPDLTSTTEYDLVKNGILFPGKDTTEEAYVLKNGKRFVKSTTKIVYKSYKFTTVEAEVNY
jgi:hypothetical protein